MFTLKVESLKHISTSSLINTFQYRKFSYFCTEDAFINPIISCCLDFSIGKAAWWMQLSPILFCLGPVKLHSKNISLKNWRCLKHLRQVPDTWHYHANFKLSVSSWVKWTAVRFGSNDYLSTDWNSHSFYKGF